MVLWVNAETFEKGNLSAFLKNSRNLRAFVVIIAVTLLISVAIFNRYIIGGEPFISLSTWSDIIRANLPTYTMMYDALSDGLYLWSWNMGAGTSMFAHADVYFDPFTYIAFLDGRDGIAHMMVWVLVAKLVCEALAMAVYLRHFRLDPCSIIIGSLLYAFCSFSLIMGVNLALGTVLVYLPLILLGVEHVVEGKRPWLLIVSLFLLSICSYYFLYITAFIAVLYAILRTYGEWRKMAKVILTLFLCGVLAVMLAAAVLLPQVELLTSSSRLGSGDDVSLDFGLLEPAITFYTAVIRLFDPNTLGYAGEYYGYVTVGKYDYFQPTVFVTCLIIPLLLQIIAGRNARRSRQTVALIILTAAMLIFPVFSYILNGFSTINYRWLYGVQMAECVACALAFEEIFRREKPESKIWVTGCLFSAGILVATLYYYCDLQDLKISEVVSDLWLPYCIIAVMLIASSVIAILPDLKHEKFGYMHSRKFITVMMVASICICSVAAYYDFYNSDDSSASFEEGSDYGYDDTSSEVISDIMASDDSFFRINKDFDSVYDDNGIPSDNDAMVQGYYGLKSYSSMNNGGYADFLMTMGVNVCTPIEIEDYIEKGIDPLSVKGQSLNYINGVDDKYDLLDYFGVKYYITKLDSGNEVPSQFSEYSTDYSQGNIGVYVSDSAYSLGFINSNCMTYDDLMALSYDERVPAVMHHTITYGTDDSLTYSTDDSDTADCTLTYFSSDHLEFTATGSGDWQYVSFSIPYDSGWKATVDGEEVDVDKINVGLIGVKISSGEHTVVLDYSPDSLTIGEYISAGALVIIIAVVLWTYREKIASAFRGKGKQTE